MYNLCPPSKKGNDSGQINMGKYNDRELKFYFKNSTEL